MSDNALFSARPIWLEGGGADDEYVDFYPDFRLLPGHDYVLRIASDTDWNVWCGEKLCGFGQYADYPGRLIYDEVPLPADGGTFTVTAWHSGIDCFTYVKHKAYLVFCLLEDGKPVLISDRSIASALCPRYIQHVKRSTTPQMGLGFSCRTDIDSAGPASASAEVDEIFTDILPRPNCRLTLGEKAVGAPVKRGTYKLADGELSADPAVNMKNAAFDAGRADGEYYIFDLGRETVGFPDITLTLDHPADVMVGWGEHLTDGRCRASIHIRSFSFLWKAAAGINHVFPALRRIGCRYLQVFVPGGAVNTEVSVVPVLYPVEVLPSPLTGLRRRIRDAAVHTLRCCMHEHYEDCPWREQSFYTLDSRNQMVTGYKVFKDGNAGMVRASLDLVSRGVRKDGLLMLCYPAGLDRPIPLYSLAYFIQMDEYLNNTGDLTLAKEKYDVLTDIASVFTDRITDKGLIRRFPDRLGIWNFYEWSPSMFGDAIHKNTPDDELPYEAPINAALVLALRAMSDISEKTGHADDARRYAELAEGIASRIAEVFFCHDDGLFASYTDNGRRDTRSVLTQALCVLCGADEKLAAGQKDKMLDVIEKNGGHDTIPATLSMACFRYDALLKTDAGRFSAPILTELDSDGEYMLSRDATTFWETIKGEADFNGAGSLCHGWSAMAAYYYALLL